MESKAVNVRLAHRSRLSQVPIYLGKQLRNFIYINDWKILPTAAVIASLVSLVVRESFFDTMEGTILGAFAVAFVCIWNGCFNSIQVVCRERDVIKREHRSGMHISSYILANVLYQALLCLLQTIITVVILRFSIKHFPETGFITKWFELDLGLTCFLITFASDMLALFISCLVRTTTAAMTVMPFVLIFLLLFSGSMFSLPSWASSISKYTLSGQGVNCVAALADYNGCRSITGSNILGNVWDNSVSGEVPLKDIIKLFQDDTGPLAGFRKIPAKNLISEDNQEQMSILINACVADGSLSAESASTLEQLTIGELFDAILSASGADYEGVMVPYDFTIHGLLQSSGKTRTVINAIQSVTAKSMYKPQFEHSRDNVESCWLALGVTAVICMALATVCLEFIDNDKR